MTRFEAIDVAAQETYTTEMDDPKRCAFTIGADWADSNPNWRPFPDEKPAHDLEVLVQLDNDEVTIGRWKPLTNEWELPAYRYRSVAAKRVVYWMLKPLLRKN